MKRAGRISLVLLAVIVLVLVSGVVIIFLGGRESPDSVATKFLSALAKGDVTTLTALSDMGDTPSDEVRKAWDYAVHVAGPYYRFKFAVEGTAREDADSASVNVQIETDYGQSDAYPDNYEIPLDKVNGHWKVEVRSLNRDIFPGLPR